ATAAAGASKLEDLSPATRRIVEENRVDPDLIPGTGRGGRLTKEDVQNFIDKGGRTGNGEGAAAAPASPAPATQPVRHEAPASMTTPSPKSAPAAGGGAMNFDAHGERRVPMSKIRR